MKLFNAMCKAGFIFGFFFLFVGCGEVEFEAIPQTSTKVVTPDPDLPPDEIPDDPDPVDPLPIQKTQTFTQNSSGEKIDILVVVDNSDSMMGEHNKRRIRNMFQNFLETLDGVDYQIGITTTNYFNTRNVSGWGGTLEGLRGENLKIIKPSTPQKQTLFLSAVDRQEAVKCRTGKRDEVKACGSNTEQPLRVIQEFVNKRDQENAGFFREDSEFITIVISDEDEANENGNIPVTAAEVVSHVNRAFNGNKKYTNYSVIIEPGDRECKRTNACWEFLCLGGGEYGNYISELSRISSGRTASICSTDISSDLKVIGSNARNGGLFDEVKIQHDPVGGIVSVEFNPGSDIEYTLEGRTIKFNRAPVAGTEITVNYRHHE